MTINLSCLLLPLALPAFSFRDPQSAFRNLVARASFFVSPMKFCFTPAPKRAKLSFV
jgi:hypothetical protein